jgi:regulator of RNase E activity RraB
MYARSPNKQLQRTVMDKVPRHMRQRAAAELRRWASRTLWDSMKIVVSLVMFLNATLFSSTAFSQQAALEQDANVVALLKQNGSDLSKLHNVDFFLILPNKSAADSVASELKVQGYSIRRSSRVPESESWEVHAQRKVAPQLETMQGLTVALTKLAEKYGGLYDGWGAETVK